MFLSSSLRHRLLEALRVASVWRHGNSINHATPVLPYARLAFTHTLTFLNKVRFVATHKNIHTHVHTYQFISYCLCVCADRLGAHVGGECGAGSSWSGAVGRTEICQIQGM